MTDKYLDSHNDSHNLLHAAHEFAEELTQAMQFFEENPPKILLSATRLKGRQVVAMRFAKNEGSLGVLNLRSKEWPVLGLIIEFHCGWDSRQRHLAVEKSSLTVTPHGRENADPLFRVEYVKEQDSHRPSSHIHVHAHRDEFTHLMGFASKFDVERTKKVRNYFRRGTRLSELHFPTGGHRFRPCLEDVLEMLRVEFKLDVDNSKWQQHLRTARENWRRTQLAAAVRDCPDEALRALVDEYGMPEPTGWTLPEFDTARQKKFARS